TEDHWVVAFFEVFAELRRILRVGVAFLQVAEVLTGAERPAGARQNNATRTIFPLQLADDFRQFACHRVIARIERVGSVRSDGADLVGSLNLEGFVGSHGSDSHSRVVKSP